MGFWYSWRVDFGYSEYRFWFSNFFLIFWYVRVQDLNVRLWSSGVMRVFFNSVDYNQLKWPRLFGCLSVLCDMIKGRHFCVYRRLKLSWRSSDTFKNSAPEMNSTERVNLSNTILGEWVISHIRCEFVCPKCSVNIFRVNQDVIAIIILYCV